MDVKPVLLKKATLIAMLIGTALAACADQVPDVKAGKDLILRNVGGTLSFTVLGSTSTSPLAPTPLVKVVKPAGSLGFTEDLYNFVPELGLHTDVTYTGIESSTGTIQWTLSDPSIIGKTVKLTYKGTTYNVVIDSFTGSTYEKASKVTQPAYETLDYVYRGTSLTTEASPPSQLTITGTSSGLPVTVTMSASLSGLAGVAVTAPFVEALLFDSPYLTTGTTHGVTAYLNKTATVNETVALAGGYPLSGPSSIVITAGHSQVTFNVTVGSLTSATPTWASASLGGYSIVMPSHAGPKLFSVLSGTGPYFSGSSATFTVTLSVPAPAGGAVIALHADEANSVLPSTVTVPAGKTTVSFDVQVPAAQKSLVLSVVASYAGAYVRASAIMN